MKIIDEKGKLFGKINVIDFLVIVFLICLMPMFYFGYKFLTVKPPIETTQGELIEKEINCQFIQLKPEILKLISAGDKELGPNGRVIGEIIALGQDEPYRRALDIGGGTKIIIKLSGSRQLEAKLRLQLEVRQNKLYYKNQEVKMDLPFKFETDKYFLTAVPFIEQEETVLLKIKFANLIPELCKLIKVGNEEIERGKSHYKEVNAKVNRIISNKPAEFITLFPEKEGWQIKGHPKNRDVILEIEILSIRKPDGLYLKNRPLKVGNEFEFYTDLYFMKGIILEIQRK